MNFKKCHPSCIFKIIGLWVVLSLPYTLMGQNNTDVVKTITFGIESPQPSRGEILFSGTVKEARSNTTITGAVIQILEINKNAVSDEKGNFIFHMMPGKYNLKVSFLGFEDYLLRLHIYENARLDISLDEKILNLNEVTISQNQTNANITGAMGGVEQMSIERLAEKSKFLGETDVLRSIQSLPGVVSTGESASGFNVQGGNTDQNLILQDGNLIINPVHALGFFSLFHPDLVKDITLFKGEMPAKYGGRLSSVLDIKLKEGNDQEVSVKGGIGIAASRLAIEGPIIKNKVSFVIGTRASYFDWILKRVNNLDLRKSQAFFYDLTAKIDARVSPSTKIGVNIFNTGDKFQFAEEAKFDYRTTTGSAYLKQIIGKKMNLNGLVNIGQYHSNLFDIEGNNQSKFTNKIDYIRNSLSLYNQMSAKYNMEFGIELNTYRVSPGEIIPLGGTNSLTKPKSLIEENAREVSSFFQNQINLGTKVEIIAGIRYTRYQNIGKDIVYLYAENVPKSESAIQSTVEYQANKVIKSYAGLEPKISLRYSINSENLIKAGYNRAYQYINQISNTASATPIDIWQISNYYIAPQRAHNFSLGYYRNTQDNGLQSSMAFFYRKISQLIEYKDFAELLLNDHIETELVSGIGKAYGVEITLNKNTGRHRFESNYTYSRSLRQVISTALQDAINDGKWYPSNFDKPHVLNLNYIYKTSTRNSLSLNFTYSTGRPTTAPVSSYINSNIYNIPIYSNRNEYRVPDFHRLDAAYTIAPQSKRKNNQHSYTFSVYNVYARKNAYSVFFVQKPFQKVSAYRVAVLGTVFPAFTYNFKF